MPMRRVKKTDQLLFVTTDSQTDMNLVSVEEIMKELNCLNLEKKKKSNWTANEHTETLKEKTNLVDLEP